MRTVFAAGIVATALAAIAVLPASWSFTPISILKSTLAISAILAFVFLLMKAAALKHVNPGTLGELRIGKRITMFCYDESINVYAFTAAYFVLWCLSLPLQRIFDVGETLALFGAALTVIALCGVAILIINIVTKIRRNN